MVSPRFDCLEHETPEEDLKALKQLVRLATPANAACRVVEVGSWVGGTALAMVKAGASVYCVDHFDGNPGDRLGEMVRKHGAAKVFGVFMANCKPYLYRRIFPCVGTSLVWAASWPFQVDMVFIDANHEYHAVLDDIIAWWPHVRPNGIIAGHDYSMFPGVTKAADKFGKEGVWGRTVWWKKKGEA